jgi:hypothetical protein
MFGFVLVAADSRAFSLFALGLPAASPSFSTMPRSWPPWFRSRAFYGTAFYVYGCMNGIFSSIELLTATSFFLIVVNDYIIGFSSIE